MVEVGRCPWKTPGPTLLGQGHLEQVTRASVMVAFEDLQRGESASSEGSRCQCSVTDTAQKSCLMLRWSIFCSTLCPLLLVLALGAWKEPGSIFSAFFLQVFMNIHEIPPQPPFLWAETHIFFNLPFIIERSSSCCLSCLWTDLIPSVP